MEPHRHLDDELSSLRDVCSAGGEAEQALERAMYSLRERDTVVANRSSRTTIKSIISK